MAFNPSIPQATDIPAVSQGQILTNFTQLNNIFANNHVTFDAASDNGKHNFCQFPEQGAAPATAVNEGAVYTRVGASAVTELFFRRENNGVEVQLTGNVVDAGFASAYCTFTGAGVLSANSLNVAGVVRNSIGNYTISFTNAFANTNYVVATSVSINDATAMSSIYSITKAAGSVTVVTRRTNTGNLVDAGTIEVVIFGILA